MRVMAGMMHGSKMLAHETECIARNCIDMERSAPRILSYKGKSVALNEQLSSYLPFRMLRKLKQNKKNPNQLKRKEKN